MKDDVVDTDNEVQNDEQQKDFDGFLIIDWKNEDARFRKTDPEDNISPFELAIPVGVAITLPEVAVPKIEADITVPAAEVEEAVTEQYRTGKEQGEMEAERL